jgi:membrane protein CcdC involved in cytochrome C biogenesis
MMELIIILIIAFVLFVPVIIAFLVAYKQLKKEDKSYEIKSYKDIKEMHK